MNKITLMMSRGGVGIVVGLCLVLVVVAGYAWMAKNDVALVSESGTSVTATLDGSVAYVERIALAPGSLTVVELLDVTNPDVPIVVSEVTVPTEGKNIPISFSLNYDPALIEKSKSYGLSARIMEGETIRLASIQPRPVLTNGNQVNEVALMVAPPKAESEVVSSDPPFTLPSTELAGTRWVWQYTDGDVSASAERILAPDGEKFILSFGAEGFTSSTDCNQLSGSYLQVGESLSMGPIAATMKACVDETLEAVYATELGRVTSFAVTGDELRLNLQDNTGTMVFTKQVDLSSEEEAIFCTQEAKECPDGTFVGRSGPLCEFAACPGA